MKINDTAMLPSLGIRNYRNLKSLDIEKLARVNLIAGKNNTGKTSLLETIAIYASEGSLRSLDELLKTRGEFYSEKQNSLKNNIRTYSSLFPDRETDFSQSKLIIGPLEYVQIGTDKPEELKNSVSASFAKMYSVESKLVDADTKEVITRRVWKFLEKNDEDSKPFRTGLAIRFDGEGPVHMLDELNRETLFFYVNSQNHLQSHHFVKAACSNGNNAELWSRIALTEKEDYVVHALRIIEPAVEKISFIEDTDKGGKEAVVRLNNSATRTHLQSMGDGMNRILTIILALVNAKDGYLLIDEFENGLHYKVQQDLWKMIFQLATELNVQVFATTHSEDCVEAFENVLNNGNQNEGLFIRLEKRGEVIKSVLFDAKELQVATDHAIEIR